MEKKTQQQTSPGIMLLWNDMSMAKKISIMVFTAAFLIATVLFINYFTTPKLGLLFRGLNTDSASAVIARLDEMGVPYTLRSGGQEILVAENRIDELRITLSSDGSLYGGGTGFELFDQTKLGISESERRLNYQRALQGELQRTIAQIEGISQARVHLVIPEPSVFLRETSVTTASVVLKLNPLGQLRNDQVMGIVYLVAGSVENLTPENVTLIDTQGRILSKMDNDGFSQGEFSASATLNQLEIKNAFEKELEYRLQGMLERVLGSGTVVAMVTAEMDFDSHEITEITYGEPVLRSRSRTEEGFEGNGSQPLGEAGADSNIPAYPIANIGQGDSSYSRLDEIENYEISETLTHSIKAPGKVTNISASVIYDNSRDTLTYTQMEELENLVASALGFSPERGDKVSISSIGFDSTYLEETIIAMEEAAQAEKTSMYIRYGLTAAAVLAGLILLLLILGRLKQFVEEQPGYRLAAATSVPAAIEELPQLDKEETHKDRIRNITKQNPDTAISLLKMWLMEDQR